MAYKQEVNKSKRTRLIQGLHDAGASWGETVDTAHAVTESIRFSNDKERALYRRIRLCTSKGSGDHIQATCRDFALRPLVALAYIDRVVDSRVVDINILIILIPLVRGAVVLMLLLAGGVVDLCVWLDRARYFDVLAFSGRTREVGWWAMPRGYR